MQRKSSKKGSEDNSWRILIVDDEQDIREVIKMGLEREGYHVQTSGDPQAVLASYKPGEYDLLLLDIRMPGISGFELFRAIRKIDSKVKVCFITAFEIYYDEFRRVFPKIHVNCFVRKPVTIAQLSKIIAEELARSSPVEEEAAEQVPNPLKYNKGP